MNHSVKSANLHGVGDLRYEDTPLSLCGEDEVTLQVHCCGICGSDLGRVFVKGTYHFPTIIGHEFSGRVVHDPKSTLEGMRAVVFPLLPCFACESCLAGNYATCAHYDYYGSRRDGGMTEYLNVRRWNVIPMPQGLSYAEGAMCEPVSVARHAVRKLGIAPGERMFISGAGPIGLVAGMWARHFGAAQVYYIDVDQRKLDFAKILGFASYAGETVDCALEGTGYSDALERCLASVRPGGRVVLMGNPAGEVTLSQNTYWYILRKELHVAGTWNSSFNDRENDWKESLRAMAAGEIDVRGLITHRYPLSQCLEAFAMMKEHRAFYNKVMLEMNGGDDE